MHILVFCYFTTKYLLMVIEPNRTVLTVTLVCLIFIQMHENVSPKPLHVLAANTMHKCVSEAS